MIYFVQAEIIGRIKIGYASQATLSRRLSCLGVASPVSLNLLVVVRGDRVREKVLHDRFSHARVRGEWFDPKPDLVRYIARLQGRRPKERNIVRRRVVAADWLVERFREKREWTSDELFRAARAANVSRDAIFEAKAALLLPKARKVTQESGETVWLWWVPPDWELLHADRPD